MNERDFTRKAKAIVRDFYYNGNIEIDDIYIVWSCKTLQNSKALISTVYHDLMYFEVTYNGDKKEFYLDAYKKIKNIPIEDYEI